MSITYIYIYPHKGLSKYSELWVLQKFNFELCPLDMPQHTEHTHTLTCSHVSNLPARYSITAAMYTGAPMPMRYLCVPMRRYRIMRPTGKMTPALAERDSLVAFFFPPLADMFVWTQCDNSQWLTQTHANINETLVSRMLCSSKLY